MALALVVIAVLALIVLVWLVSGVRVVHADHKAVIERFGRYRRTVDPGLRLTLRYVHTLRLIDQREMVDDVAAGALTSDGVALGIDVAVFHECTDPRRFVYDVGDFPLAISRLTETHLRGLVRDMTLEDVLAGGPLPAELCRCLGEVAETWGVRITRVEIARIELPSEVAEALSQKVAADRYREALVSEEEGAVLAAAVKEEGAHQARLRRAEVKQAMTLMRAEREAEAIRVLADAERYQQQAMARAQADAIRIVSRAIQDGWASPELLAVRYLEVHRPTATGQAMKVVLPAESAGLLGPLTSVVELGPAGGSPPEAGWTAPCVTSANGCGEAVGPPPPPPAPPSD